LAGNPYTGEEAGKPNARGEILGQIFLTFNGPQALQIITAGLVGIPERGPTCSGAQEKQAGRLQAAGLARRAGLTAATAKGRMEQKAFGTIT
jgi:hypothetical protein